MKIKRAAKRLVDTAITNKRVRQIVLGMKDEERAAAKGYAISKAVQKKRYRYDAKQGKFV